jgi:hypothetical protein
VQVEEPDDPGSVHKAEGQSAGMGGKPRATPTTGPGPFGPFPNPRSFPHHRPRPPGRHFGPKLVVLSVSAADRIVDSLPELSPVDIPRALEGVARHDRTVAPWNDAGRQPS